MPWGVRIGSHQGPSLLLDSAELGQNWGMTHHLSPMRSCAFPCVQEQMKPA